MGKRISYLDVAKGFLAILVVYYHLPQMYERFLCMHNLTIMWIEGHNYIIAAFFMQAFFFITGMCSRFEGPFLPFLWKNIKTIIIPAISLTLILQFSLGNFHIINFLKQAIFYGGTFWFLTALFYSKLFVKLFIDYIPSVYIRYLLLIGLLILGVILNNIKPFPNLYYHQQTFTCAIFVALGYSLKRVLNFKIMVIGCFLYIITICLLILFKINIPTVTLGIHLRLTEIPLYLLLACSGTLLILLISKLIDSNKVLEFIGKQSLILYCLQTPVIIFIEKLWIKFLYIPLKISDSVLFYIIIGALSILLMLFISQILNKKYIRTLLGKF